MSIIGIIPARYNSTRFPGKLLKKIRDRTILQHTFEGAKACKELKALYIATDSESIAEHAHDIGAEVLWTSSNPEDGTERIAEALQTYPALQKSAFIVNLQADHPRTEPLTIQRSIEALLKDPKAMVATPITPIRSLQELRTPHVVKCVFDQYQRALYFSRSIIPYGSEKSLTNAFAHIGIYVYRRSFFNELLQKKKTPLQNIEKLEQLKILEWGYKMRVAIVQEPILGIDTPEDLEKFELLCR